MPFYYIRTKGQIMTTGKLLVLLGVLSFAAGCAVYTRPVAPPVRVEVQPMRPHAKAMWVPGHWQWSRWHHRYVWVQGHWVIKKHRW
jgi:hypothetical protein